MLGSISLNRWKECGFFMIAPKDDVIGSKTIAPDIYVLSTGK